LFSICKTEEITSIIRDNQARLQSFYQRPETETCLLPVENQNGAKKGSENGRAEVKENRTQSWEVTAAVGIDVSCRFAFPLMFLLFNGFYWWYYLVHT